jgi:hypothetical protein
MKQPKLGQMIYWYSGGDKKNGAVPMLVTAVSQYAVRGAVIQPGATQIVATQWIRHLDDPYYIERPQLKNRDGAWDWADPLDAGLVEEPAVLIKTPAKVKAKA